MPNSIVTHLLERVATLEAKVESLLTYQKWTMALLSAVFMLALGAMVRGLR
jgi:hypothetical protein